MPNFDDIDLTDVIMDGDPYGEFEDPGGGGEGGDSPILLGTCTTSAATAAKVVTLMDVTDFELTKGTAILVKFTNTNTAQNPTLNVNNTGAKSIYYNTSVVTTGSLSAAGEANRYIEYMYDGTNWVWIGSSIDRNTTYSNISKSELITGTATTSRVVRADYLKSAILDLANPVGTIIESTTCDTMAKVVAAYGGTTWIQHTGYVLRGATSGVNFNSNTNDGGADSVTVSSVASHNHSVDAISISSSGAHQHKPYYTTTPKSGGSGAEYPSCTSDRSTSKSNYYINASDGSHTHSVPSHTAKDKGASYTISTLPKYKNVYIWERTA